MKVHINKGDRIDGFIDRDTIIGAFVERVERLHPENSLPDLCQDARNFQIQARDVMGEKILGSLGLLPNPTIYSRYSLSRLVIEDISTTVDEQIRGIVDASVERIGETVPDMNQMILGIAKRLAGKYLATVDIATIVESKLQERLNEGSDQ